MSAPNAKRSSRATVAYAMAISVFYVVLWLGARSHLVADILTPARLAPVISLGKLIPQAIGAYYAARSAQHYEIGSRIRHAWKMVSLWLGCWFCGQLALGIYVIALRHPPPSPSLVDLFFVAGFGIALHALSTFTSTYRASGFSVEGRADHRWIVAGVSVLLALLGYRILLPLVAEPMPFFDRVFTAIYPILDLLMLASVMLLLRITRRFHGGRVWPVWAAMLAGIFCATGGDVLFAYTEIQTLIDVTAPLHLAFTLGYVFCAYGMRLQYELVSSND